MADPIDFYFEFSSPYGYFASERVAALADKHDRAVSWKPFLLGAAFKREGTQSLVSYPLKGPYSKRDIERTAGYLGLPFVWPPGFPILTVHAARATLWAQENAPDRAVDLIHALYRRLFAEGVDIGHAGDVVAVAEKIDLDPAALEAGMKSDEIKNRLRAETDAALDRGVFGSPFFIVDGERFWGADRMDMLDAWLTRGGW